MNFELTPEQTVLKDSVKKFCRDKYAFGQHMRASLDMAERGYWQDFAELGWLGAGLGESEGGFGGGPVEAAIVAEEFGRTLVAEPFISGVVFPTRILHEVGGATSFVEQIAGGETSVTVAWSEPDAWGNPGHAATTAVREGPAGWRLNGHKSLVLAASQSDVAIVSARTGGEIDSPCGITLFRIPLEHAGLKRRDYRLVDRRPVSDLWFTDVVVADNAIIGRLDQGLPALVAGLDHAGATLCADSLGAMETLLWQTRDYLKTRKQFGQTLSSFQALQHRMADMLITSELARSMVFQALAALGETAADRAKGISASRAAVAKAAEFVGKEAIQLHGAIAMTEELPVGHYYRRLLTNAGLFGGTEYHRSRFIA